MWLYDVLYLRGPEADPLLTDLTITKPAGYVSAIDQALAGMKHRAPDLEGRRHYGDLVLREGDIAARKGAFILVWNPQEWDLQLLRTEV